MKSLGKDMLSLLVAVIAAVFLLWGSDALTYRLIQSHGIYTTAMPSLLSITGAQVLALVVLLIVIVFCAVSFF